MESLNTKIEKLRSIASSLGLHGESVEVIVQMLGYALHSSEVEHIAYSQEATLERATNINSKIQHCVNMMYSVYRGHNPRVIISFNPQKRFTFNPGDLVAKSNTYNIYYLGYWDETGGVNNEGDFIYSGITIYPKSSEKVALMCLLSSKEETFKWKIDTGNLFYHTIGTDTKLSSNYFLELSDTENGEYEQVTVTRQFSEHERKNYFFDLTLPGMGMRIYYPSSYGDILNRSDFSDKWMKLRVHEYLKLSDLNENELKNLKIQGSIPVPIYDINDETQQNFYNLHLKYNSTDYIRYDSLIFIKESGVDNLGSIHYLANQNRYSGSIMATNQDLSFMLSEAFPEKIRQTDGVSYEFNSNNNKLKLYYVPTDSSLDLTDSEKQKFIGENGSYYVTKEIEITRGKRYNVNIILDVDLYTNKSLTEEISELLQRYQNRFGIDLGDQNNMTSQYQEIISLITKLSEVRYVSNMKIEYIDSETGEIVNYKDPNGKIQINPQTSYFIITSKINSTVSSQ